MLFESLGIQFDPVVGAAEIFRDPVVIPVRKIGPGITETVRPVQKFDDLPFKQFYGSGFGAKKENNGPAVFELDILA